jgi:GT2 family glycosyltransferase
MPTVSVIIPNWNRRPDLERLLATLARQTHPVDEVIVVDNGSSDGSPDAAERAGARVIRLENNHGFSRAVNLGVSAARTELVAVVNNDIELEPDWLRHLVKATGSDGAWFATGKLLNAQRRDWIDGTFDTICRGACAWRAGHGRPDSREWSEPRPIRLVPFTAALFRAELFRKVGLLDERFESYLEDVDFGLRCAGAGLAGAYVPAAVAYHAGSATLGPWHAETVRRISRNQVLLVAKHFPRGWVWRYGWPVLVAQGLWGLVAARHGRGGAFLRGKLEGLRLFRATRRSGASGCAGHVVDESERDLLALQQRSGFDWYWRLYFALT